jgi:hypothetical protein
VQRDVRSAGFALAAAKHCQTPVVAARRRAARQLRVVFKRAHPAWRRPSLACGAARQPSSLVIYISSSLREIRPILTTIDSSVNPLLDAMHPRLGPNAAAAPRPRLLRVALALALAAALAAPAAALCVAGAHIEIGRGALEYGYGTAAVALLPPLAGVTLSGKWAGLRDYATEPPGDVNIVFPEGAAAPRSATRRLGGFWPRGRRPRRREAGLGAGCQGGRRPLPPGAPAAGQRERRAPAASRGDAPLLDERGGRALPGLLTVPRASGPSLPRRRQHA